MGDPYELMRHALGVQFYSNERWSKPYRNHFVAGADHVEVWRELVRKGLAVEAASPSERTGGCPVFMVSFDGQKVALAGLTFKRRWGYGTPTHGGGA